MSLHAYMESRKLEADDLPFEALVMAAMRRADTDNLARLVGMFPEIYTELDKRYNAPQGLLPGEANPHTGDRMLSNGNLVDSEGHLLREADDEG